MAGITIDKLTELTSPTEITNFLVGGGNAKRMSLSTLLSWLKPKVWTAPDWANRSDFSNGSTMAEDGYIYVGQRAETDRMIVVSVNGVVAARAISPSTIPESGMAYSSLIPVAAGDVVSVNFNATEAGGTGYQQYLHFVPLKK